MAKSPYTNIIQYIARKPNITLGQIMKHPDYPLIKDLVLEFYCDLRDVTNDYESDDLARKALLVLLRHLRKYPELNPIILCFTDEAEVAENHPYMSEDEVYNWLQNEPSWCNYEAEWWVLFDNAKKPEFRYVGEYYNGFKVSQKL